ncbi:unnamed protein product, partial [marine sediment metagenome]
CGSEMHIYKGVSPYLKPSAEKPVVPGHEFGGIIKSINIGKQCDFKPGMKVVVYIALNCGNCFYCLNGMDHLCENQKFIDGWEIDGGMREETTIPLDNLVELPSSFDLLYSTMIEPTAVAVHAVDKINDSKVLIIGSGLIGLLILKVAKLNNNRVIALDIDDYALRKAGDLMADLVINFVTVQT